MKQRGAGSFREKYEECVNHPELSRETVPAIDIMKRIMRSQLETGYPFMFYRDEVNRANANKHEGMIYSSNLCTEITQNRARLNLNRSHLKTILLSRVQNQVISSFVTYRPSTLAVQFRQVYWKDLSKSKCACLITSSI